MQKGLAHTEQYGDRRGMSDGDLLVEKVGVDARGRAITMLTRRRNKDTESGSGWKATGKTRIRDDNGKLTWWSRGTGSDDLIIEERRQVDDMQERADASGRSPKRCRGTGCR
jgi:hypothetical protein